MKLNKKQHKSKPRGQRNGPAVLRLKSERVQSPRFPAQPRGRKAGALVGRPAMARRVVRRSSEVTETIDGRTKKGDNSCLSRTDRLPTT
jgi:hypothetical protein